MKYTVIVPVFNSEETIADCLRSIINQRNVTFNEDYSILVVDDGSTDKTSQILREFPVEVIRFPKNEGRIVARLTGAKNAATNRVLFVDSRVTLADDLISRLDEFTEYPAVMGELHKEELKYDSVFQTVFYLIRRRYYGREYFPMKADELLIDEKNFRRAPKGTAVLLIDRDLFIELTPERTGRDVNDDTLLFHSLVFKQKLNLLRSKKLFFRYSQRTDLRQFSSWLFHRGVRFSDFYLRPGGYFFIPFLLFLSIAAVGFISLLFTGGGFYYLLAFVAAANAAISIYLAENRRDWFTAFVVLPVVAAIFGAGIARFWAGVLVSGIRSGIGIAGGS